MEQRLGGFSSSASPAVFVVFHMMFSKLVGKHTVRIRSYGSTRTHVLKFFDLKGYILMTIMMGGGIALRNLNIVPGWFVAFFYTGLGLALSLAGIGFLVHYIKERAHREMPRHQEEPPHLLTRFQASAHWRAPTHPFAPLPAQGRTALS